MNITDIKNFVIKYSSYIINILVIIGSIFVMRWWGIRGISGFLTGSALTIVLLIKRNNYFEIFYKLLNGDKEYTNILLGNKPAKKNNKNEWYK